MLSFDEENHIYKYSGRVVPSVTGILSPICQYNGIPDDVLMTAAERGTYVHKCCELLVWGTLDMSQVREDCTGYVEAFKQFLIDTGFKTEFIEQRVYHKTFKYAGTIDLVGILPPSKLIKKPHRALIDIKTTFKLMRSVGPQTFAYADAWGSHFGQNNVICARYALQLKKTGQYEMYLLKSKSDANIFLSCLNIYKFSTGE